MITINGIEINIDFTDADIIEKIDQAGEKVRKKIEELEKNKKDITPAEGIRQECEILKEFLDYVIEDGISKKIPTRKTRGARMSKPFYQMLISRRPA